MKNLKINYDPQADVLYISFGKPRPSYAEDLEEGVYVRKDMDTDELTGITITEFTKRQEHLKNVKFPGGFDIQDIDRQYFMH